jgi:hypothetical protein
MRDARRDGAFYFFIAWHRARFDDDGRAPDSRHHVAMPGVALALSGCYCAWHGTLDSGPPRGIGRLTAGLRAIAESPCDESRDLERQRHSRAACRTEDADRYRSARRVVLQEIKAAPTQVPDLLVSATDHWSYWHGAGGYSGVA